jgi:hypothetical protein
LGVIGRTIFNLIEYLKMKKFITALIGLNIFVSMAFAQKIPVEGWFKSTGIDFGETWKDSGKRTHTVSATHRSEITLYGEGFGFRGKSEADWGLSILDKHINGRIVFRSVWTSSENSSVAFKGHASCDLTSGSTTCVMWFKGYGDYEGKIMELTLNEKDSAASEDDPDTGPNLYMLEGIVMNEPIDE